MFDDVIFNQSNDNKARFLTSSCVQNVFIYMVKIKISVLDVAMITGCDAII